MEATQVTERSEQLELALERITKWQNDGTLDNIDKLLHFLNAALDSMTPEIVDGLVGTLVELMELGDQFMQSKLFKLAPDILTTTENMLAEPPQSKPGLRHLMKSIREPEVQTGMQFMIGFMREVGKGIQASQK
jgi:uncharacterized protein YjgD (DUF1641 family)